MSKASADEPLTPLERALALLLLAAALALRVCYAAHFRIDSDEPQHLHVVWAWTRGLLPYRDVFDNHMPLFQMLCAPLFRALGVRADIVVPMRMAMIPIFAATIWCVWKIAASLFSARVACWTAVLAALCPPFFFTSVEFRPDQLWTLCWLASLAVLLGGRFSRRRSFFAGVLLGAAFCVSMKSTLMLISLALAGAGAFFVWKREADRRDCGELWWCTAAFVAGMLILPVLVVLAFTAVGAGLQMRYCVLQHNVLPSSKGPVSLKALIKWLVSLALLGGAAAAICRSDFSVRNRWRIVLIVIAPFAFLATLLCFWPILTAEDYLPFFPLAAVAVVPLLLGLASRLHLPSRIAPAVAASACIAWIVGTVSPLDDQTVDKIGMVADTLKLTNETDFVMDAKGDTIYRRRPWPYVLETMTSHRIHHGLIADNIAARLVETQTPLAMVRRMPEAAREFIRANYVPIAFRLVALGKTLRAGPYPFPPDIEFEIAIPARYTLVCATEPFAGTLNGEPFTGPRTLAAGHYTLHQTAGSGALALIWAQAIERGYSPFTTLKKDRNTAQD